MLWWCGLLDTNTQATSICSFDLNGGVYYRALWYFFKLGINMQHLLDGNQKHQIMCFYPNPIKSFVQHLWFTSGHSLMHVVQSSFKSIVYAWLSPSHWNFYFASAFQTAHLRLVRDALTLVEPSSSNWLMIRFIRGNTCGLLMQRLYSIRDTEQIVECGETENCLENFAGRQKETTLTSWNTFHSVLLSEILLWFIVMNFTQKPNDSSGMCVLCFLPLSTWN